MIHTLDRETYAIIGAALQVHATLGYGFLEKVYQAAFAHELMLRSIPYEREKRLTVYYKGTPLGDDYAVDFYCYGSILVELKALKRLSKVEEAQVVHYLRATRCNRALLINFGDVHLQVRRFVDGFVEAISPASYAVAGNDVCFESGRQPAPNRLQSAESAVPMTMCEVNCGKD